MNKKLLNIISYFWLKKKIRKKLEFSLILAVFRIRIWIIWLDPDPLQETLIRIRNSFDFRSDPDLFSLKRIRISIKMKRNWNTGQGRIQSWIRIHFSPIRIQIKMIRIHNTVFTKYVTFLRFSVWELGFKKKVPWFLWLSDLKIQSGIKTSNSFQT